MDPHPPFDHPHHRRGYPGNHYADQHSHHHHLTGGGGGGAAPARSRYELGSHTIQYLQPEHQHPPPRIYHQTPPPPPPQQLPPPPPPAPYHRHDGYAGFPLRSPPEAYSPSPYRSPPPPPPPHHPYHQQRHSVGGDDFRAADEIRRSTSHHHHHPHPPHQPHHHPQPQLSWEETEEGRRYAAHQHRLSPPGGRKRYRCALHDPGDLESTSSSGPPLRRQRQQPHPSYSPPLEDSFVDRATNYSAYSSHDGFVTHSDIKGNRKLPMSLSVMPPGSPNSMAAGYPRRAPQKSAPVRVSVWQRIEENPSVYAPPSPRKAPKEVHVSPSKTKNSGPASKELASVISVDSKVKSADYKDSDDSAGMKKNTVKKNEKSLASVVVKPAPEAKEKERVVDKVTKKPDKVENNIPGFPSGSAGSKAFPGAGVKKVKKIVIKKIVRKIGAKDKQTSSSLVSEKKDSIDANSNASEKEEGEITTSSYEKDSISANNLVSTSDTAAVGNSVGVQKEQNDDPVNLSKSKAAPSKSTCTLDTAAVSRREHSGKEGGKSSMNSADDSVASAIQSTETCKTIGAEHPGKEKVGSLIDSTGKNVAFQCENNNSQEEKEQEQEILSVSGAVNVASNSERMPDVVKPYECEVENQESKVSDILSGDNEAYLHKGEDDTAEVSGSQNGRREEGGFLVNDSIRRPITDEISMTRSKYQCEKEVLSLIGTSEVRDAPLGDSVGIPKITDAPVTQGACKEECDMLNTPREKDVVSSSSLGALNAAEISVNWKTQEKECRMSLEPSEAAISLINHVKASSTLEVGAVENMQEEIQVPMSSSASQTVQWTKAPNTAEVVMTKFVPSETGKIPMDSNGIYTGSQDNSVYTPELVAAGGTENNSMHLLPDVKAALSKSDFPLGVVDGDFSDPQSSRDINSKILPSSSAVILNDGVVRNTTSEAAELIHFHRIHPPDNNFSFLHTHDSPSVSANGEHSVPTVLTLGNNIYFSSAESVGQSEENHKLVDVNQGFDVESVAKFGNVNKRKGQSGNDFINAGVQNWLTLPLTVSSVNNGAIGSTDRLDSDQIMDEGASFCQDHDSMPDMDQPGSIDALSGQDQNPNLCGSHTPQSDPAPKDRDKNIENESEIILAGSCVNPVHVLDQYGYHTIDKPIDNSNKSIVLSSHSIDAIGTELASSQVDVDSDQTYHSNTEDHVAESSTKPDSLSSWIEAIVSEAKKEHQPCKSNQLSFSSQDKLLASNEDSGKPASNEDSGKPVSDSILSSVAKSPPRMNITSSTVSKVPVKHVALPGSSGETPRLNQNQNARHKTWRRENVSSSNSSLHVPQPSGLPPKLPLKKNGKSQNAYIRKGNALIRNPATGNHSNSSSLDTQNKLSKPVMRRSLNFVRKVDSNEVVAHSNISVERPKTPPLPLHTKSISCAMNVSDALSQALQKQQFPEAKKEDSSGQINSGVDNPSTTCLHKPEPLDTGKVVYARSKSNQLVAAQGQHPGDSSDSSMDQVLLLQPSTSSDFYFKKRKNQIVLGSSTSDVPSAKDSTQTENIRPGEGKALVFAASNNNITVAKDKPQKALQTTKTAGSFPHVWTLSGQYPRKKTFVGTSHMKAFPRILPWKRKIFSQNFRSSYSSLLNKSSLGIVRKLLQTRKRGTIYTVSTDGFSLRKSGVLSIGGSSLKWSRSLEKASKKVNEKATLAVAEIERKKREKKRRLSLRNKGKSDQYSSGVAAHQSKNNNRASQDSRVPSTCNEYIRVNKGNQLVRNPKKVIRMLASEKVRWSLHTVRTRMAKKQQYCQFFTRFGECKKSGGKCPYIHDRAKVAICTKFLKGLCSNASCKLTHKVLPERMPDCSYFLRGLCTNTACPYRHVKVNSNAPVCEDFLKGYCADGDECRKKHSYVCPIFEATGECPQESRCKLHHPKKKIKSKRSRVDTLQNNSWGRYFDTSIGHGSEARIVSSEEEERQKPEPISVGDFADFIDLGAYMDVAAEEDASDDTQLMELDPENLKIQADNLDALIKPLRIMRTARV